MPVLLALSAWSDRWATPEGGPRCCSATAAAGTFHPGNHLRHVRRGRSADLEALRGPGARPGPGTGVMGTVLPADPDLD